MKWYNKRNAVVVPFKVRSHGNAERARNRYRKWWLLKNVMFTLATELPRRAPTQKIQIRIRRRELSTKKLGKTPLATTEVEVPGIPVPVYGIEVCNVTV